jgi:hypothetical protein
MLNVLQGKDGEVPRSILLAVWPQGTTGSWDGWERMDLSLEEKGRGWSLGGSM